MDGFIKMAVRAGLILTVTAAILVLFATLTIPALNFSYVIQGLGKAFAILYHWVPGSRALVSVILVALGIIIAIKVFELASMAIRWVFKINEG